MREAAGVFEHLANVVLPPLREWLPSDRCAFHTQYLRRTASPHVQAVSACMVMK